MTGAEADDSEALRKAVGVARELAHGASSDAHRDRHASVADWLEAEVKRVEDGRLAVNFGGTPMFPPHPCALAVAHAYIRADDLGRQT